jgi:hypothetical protein
MHSGIKCQNAEWQNTKVIKVKIFFKNEMTTFWPTMLLLTLKQQDFVKKVKTGTGTGSANEQKLD